MDKQAIHDLTMLFLSKSDKNIAEYTLEQLINRYDEIYGQIYSINKNKPQKSSVSVLKPNS